MYRFPAGSKATDHGWPRPAEVACPPVAGDAGLTVAGYRVNGGSGRIHLPHPVVILVRDIQAAIGTACQSEGAAKLSL